MSRAGSAGASLGGTSREAPAGPLALPSRLAIVISSLTGGGAERVASSLARYWSEGGSEVTVVTISSAQGDAYTLAPQVRRVALDLARPSRHPLQGLARSSGRILALRRALDRCSPDVVVSFLERTNVLALLAAAGTGVPVVVCERSDPRHDEIGARWSVLRKVLYPRAAAVVVQTRSVLEWARPFCARVRVIPNYVESAPREACPGLERGPKQLVGLGRLAPEKGFDLLIEAFARAAGRREDWSLTILGEGPERGRLEAQAAALRLGARLSMPGRVVDPWRHLASSHAFALPSRYEGFPNALLEAMSHGLPVVAFDCQSGPAEIVAHGRDGLLVPPGDIEALADALSTVMGDPALRQRMGQAARDASRRFSPEVVLEQWSALLRDMVA